MFEPAKQKAPAADLDPGGKSETRHGSRADVEVSRHGGQLCCRARTVVAQCPASDQEFCSAVCPGARVSVGAANLLCRPAARA